MNAIIRTAFKVGKDIQGTLPSSYGEGIQWIDLHMSLLTIASGNRRH